MKGLRPTPQQERWIVVAARLGLDRDRPWLAEHIGGWKAVGMLTRCALFALGAVAAALATAIASFLHVPGPLFVAGLVAVVVAEWLVASGRFFGAGVEEALEVAGLLLIVFELVDTSGGAHSVRNSLLIGLAFAVAGIRFLNPLFTTLAVVALSFAVDFGVSAQNLGRISSGVIAGVFCFAAAALALALGTVRFRRPSHDQMLDWLVVVMPLAGYLWVAGRHPSGISLEVLRHASFVGLLPVLMPVIIGVAGLIVGIRRRSHAANLAFMVCVGCVAYEVRNLTGLPLEVRLIAWGSVALGLALALDRYLRTPRHGITSRSVARDRDAFSLLQLAGAGALAPSPPQAPGTPFKGGGGAFDGGGASGSY